jgi:ATP-dependent DNA helicase RecQ
MDFEKQASYQEQANSMATMVEHVFGRCIKPWQLRAAMALECGYDVVCTAATGSGKTLAFQAPILHAAIHGLAIVISPLVQLMKEQSAVWQEKGFKSIALTDETLKADPDIYHKIGRGQYSLIYISPERTLAKKGAFWTLLKHDTHFRSLIRYIIIDEAHLMISWGSTFRPDYANIGAIRHVLDGLTVDNRQDGRRIPVGVFTATASPDRIQSIMTAMKITAHDSVRINESTNRRNLFYAARSIQRGNAKDFVSYPALLLVLMN